MSTVVIGGFSYAPKEKPFIEYFKRLRNIGLDDNEIRSKTPMLLKYFKEMVELDSHSSFVFKTKGARLEYLCNEFLKYY
jgi:hypothetical protein